MKPWLQFCRHGAHVCWSCVLSFITWTFWLALLILLGVQARIALQHEFAVPAFLLRAMEERLAAAQLVGTFERATFDPTGRILFENVSASTTTIHDPIVTSRAVFVQLDPWALLVGRFEPRELRATGVDVLAPAMFSPSGRSESLLSEVDLSLRRDGAQIAIDQFAGRIANLRLAVSGAFVLPPRSGRRTAPPLAELIARNYPTWSRRLAEATLQLGALDQPELQLELTPSETRTAFVTATLHARGITLERPLAARTGPLRATTAFSLANAPTALHVEIITPRLELPESGVVAQQLWLNARTESAEQWTALTPRFVEATAASVVAQGYAAAAPFVSLELDRRTVAGSLNAFVLDAAVSLDASADLDARSAGVHVVTRVPPAWLDVVGEKIGHDLKPWVALGPPAALELDASLAPGWKLARARGHLDARDLDFHGVPLARASGDIAWDADGRFDATDIILSLGEQEARGTYTSNLYSRDYRFLLTGKLRPMQISPWFHDWWWHFFSNFEFPGPVPAADVDVQGRWGTAHESNVFVFVDAQQPVICTVPFATAHTRLFVRPEFYDGLEIKVARADGAAHGTFTRIVNPDNGEWASVDFDFASTLPVAEAARIFGPLGQEITEPFTFGTPPALTLRGHLTGPGHPDGLHQSIDITGETSGDFALYHFPLQGVKFSAAVRDRELDIPQFSTHVADGTATGNAHVSGLGAERRLRFDVKLQGARLALAGRALEQAVAAANPHAPKSADAGPRLPEDVRLDLALAAEGAFTDPYSYRGSGHAELAGTELGQVRLLGALSELLQFTSLRFTGARAKFEVKGPELAFSEVSVTGANSAIHGHGSYLLDRRTLDFNARVYPFQESKFFLQSLMGAMLTPLSAALEVKLTGSLTKPSWAFVMGPTEFFRSLTRPSPTPPAPPSAPAKPARQ